MKKRILIIANNNGLSGVNTDVKNYIDFFTNAPGGAWHENEILILEQPDLSCLKSEISTLMLYKLDYLIVVYSGHGGQEREGTILEINANGDVIQESLLQNIATRQLVIYDCCRAFSNLSEQRSFCSESTSDLMMIRSIYEKRITQSIPQQCYLYACAIGESALDTNLGGVYSLNLLGAAKSLTADYLTVGAAHETAKRMTESKYPQQHPDAILPRCLSDQSLILAINPKALQI